MTPHATLKSIENEFRQKIFLSPYIGIIFVFSGK
jgi:hypothetical protein